MPNLGCGFRSSFEGLSYYTGNYDYRKRTCLSKYVTRSTSDWDLDNHGHERVGVSRRGNLLERLGGHEQRHLLPRLAQQHPLSMDAGAWRVRGEPETRGRVLHRPVFDRLLAVSPGSVSDQYTRDTGPRFRAVGAARFCLPFVISVYPDNW